MGNASERPVLANLTGRGPGPVPLGGTPMLFAPDAFPVEGPVRWRAIADLPL